MKHRKSQIFGTIIGMVIAVAGAEPQANAATAAISGSFVNPSPAKDPDQLPYIYTGSQYSGVGTGSFTYGVPIDDQRNALVDPQFRFYADSDGHLLQDLDGSIIQWTQDDVDGGGIKVVRPDQIGQYGSRLTFSGNPSVNGVLGRPFTLGYLTFQNGTTSLGNVDSIDLSLASSSLDGQFNHHLNLRIGIITTPNQGVDRYADADFIYFPDYPQAGSFRVFEDATSTVELVGSFNSLDFNGFGRTLDGNGFLSPSITAVPEPSSMAAGALSLLVVFGAAGRRILCRTQP